MNCFHSRIVAPEDKCDKGIESESDTSVVQNRQHLCKTLGITFRQRMVRGLGSVVVKALRH